MADLASYGNPERDIEQALIALKKGTQLIKYSRKGKPKFCTFRLSTDETTLIWYSRGHERNLKLATISKIIPGQRTAVFRRFLRPEKDYLSFSLLYNNGERSLDLICKDKVEAEVWFVGLKALTSTGQPRNSKIDGHTDGGRSSYDGRDSFHTSPIRNSFGATLEISSSISRNLNTKAFFDSANFAGSDVGSGRASMHSRVGTGDGLRLSVSSAAPSYSSQGSGPDDCESLGDVYIWGAIWCDEGLAEGSLNSSSSKIDVLLPKALEASVVLDVYQVACGFRHAALVNRQGEVFSWGEESGGRLGLGVDTDIVRPQLVDSLVLNNVEYVACGEFHTIAVSAAGDVFTWGDGTYNSGLLAQGTNVSHWIPKRISGPLEGLQVTSVACGTWHSALATSNGKLFTYGDGTFGVLGHGDTENVAYPREVESLSGLRTIKVACGVWHTAAIVEVAGQPGTNILSGKLFTWGDGDKNRLGHGDKESKLVPTCISALIDYNFHKLACGHNITVGLTTSGHTFSMGSTAHGQLGNPQSDGRLPCFVIDRLMGELVEEISCGSHHVAVLTSKNEVFTWGKGANGRLGHGDVEDRKTPTLVEALKDRHVKSISCGSNFTASVCFHKWVSGADQALCSGCRQAFGFTRKRHNCYNCGLVHCRACTSRKALRAALAGNPGKPNRVCDSCFVKLKASEVGGATSGTKKYTVPQPLSDSKDRLDRGEIRSSKLLLPSSIFDSLSLVQPSQIPSLLHLKDASSSVSTNLHQISLKPVVTPALQSASNSRSVSPFSRQPSPPPSSTPISTLGGIVRNFVDSNKRTNELLNQEVQKLQAEVKSLRQRLQVQDGAMQRSEKYAHEAASMVAKESAKSSAAIELIRTLAAQMKDMAEKLPPGVHQYLSFSTDQIETLLETGGRHTRAISSSSLQTGFSESEQWNSLDNPLVINDGALNSEVAQGTDLLLQNADEVNLQSSNRPGGCDISESHTPQNVDHGVTSPKVSTPRNSSEVQSEWIEQFEPGVYVTLVQLRNGIKVFKRVRFSRKRFDKWQAQSWWNEHSKRVFEKYNCRGMENAATGAAAMGEADDAEPSSHP